MSETALEIVINLAYNESMPKLYNDALAELSALRAEVSRLTAERDAAIETFDHYRSTHIDRSLEINQLQREIAYLRSTDHAVDVAIETQEYDAETPLGQALDGAGDEAE